MASYAERIARDAVRGLKDVASSKRLEPDGHPTPDWRLRLRTGETVDLEVIQVLDQGAMRFWDQLRAKDGKSKEWPNDRLTHNWVVAVSVTRPVPERLPVGKIIKGIMRALEAAEKRGENSSVMAQLAGQRFMYPEAFTQQRLFLDARGKVMAPGTTWEEWASNSGYWLPEVLLDDTGNTYGDCNVLVLADPTLATGPRGRVKTHASGGEGSVGHDALLTAIQDGIDKKAAKGQTERSPGLKWLAVVVEGIAAWDLRDNAESGALEPDLTAALEHVKLQSFDEVWVLTRGIDNHGVLRLSATASPRCALIPTSQDGRVGCGRDSPTRDQPDARIAEIPACCQTGS